ncbi:Hypothetical predicted protein [Paramuricea clavata]|uniref:Uncharacterized protein n=1 Tax=Paramuricea clavata TaxID=317549 RepID=A0A6S7JUC6_PARCT|nr:Hypothetical predicted protein [Paramuricea clavata]
MMTWLLGFVFFACERLIVVNSQVWPQGTYGLPKPVSGCPANWQDGWIKQDLENSNPRSEFSVDLNLHIEANLTGGDIRRSFCIKTSTDTTKSWPAVTTRRLFL